MKIEKVKKATIKDLTLIIDDLKNIQFEEQLSYKFNTNDLQNTQFVEDFLSKIKRLSAPICICKQAPGMKM